MFPEQVLGTILALALIITITTVLLTRGRKGNCPQHRRQTRVLKIRGPCTTYSLQAWQAQKTDESVDDTWRPIPLIEQTPPKQPLTVEDFRSVVCSSWRMKPLLTPIEGYSLQGEDVSDLNLSRLRLVRCNLGGANLANTNLQDAELASVNLASANLQGANLTYANLGNPHLSGASLRNALLLGAVLAGTDKAELESADLTDAKYDFLTEWPPFFRPR